MKNYFCTNWTGVIFHTTRFLLKTTTASKQQLQIYFLDLIWKVKLGLAEPRPQLAERPPLAREALQADGEGDNYSSISWDHWPVLVSVDRDDVISNSLV